MKKSFLCALLALLLVLSCTVCAPAALAENACPSDCACTQTEARTRSRFELELPKYSFTQELVYGDFHIFIPSLFEKDESEDLGFDTFSNNLNGSYKIQLRIACDDSYPEVREYLDPYYGDSQKHLLDLQQFAISYIFRLVQVDECVGLLLVDEFGGKYSASFAVANRKNTLFLDITARDEEETYELLDGILEHIVAPEIPLEEVTPPQK